MPPVLYKLVQQCDVMLSPKILKRSDKLRKMKVRAIETAFPHFLSCKICLKCCSLCLIHISLSCIHSYLAKSPETCSHCQTQRLLFCLPPSWLLAAFDTVELSNLKHFLILASVTLNFSDFDHLPLSSTLPFLYICFAFLCVGKNHNCEIELLVRLVLNQCLGNKLASIPIQQ